MPLPLAIPTHPYSVRDRVPADARDLEPVAEHGTASNLSLLLLIAFLIQLFSNAALLFPPLAMIRPAQTIGGLALVLLIGQTVIKGQPLAFVRPDGILFFGFVAAAGLSVFGSVWPAYAFQACTDLLKIAVVYVLILNTADTESRVRALLWTMVLCGLFPALGSLWDWQHGVRVEGRAAWMGFFANPNEMAYSLVVLIPLAWALARRSGWGGRLILASCVASFMVAIFLSFSRGSLIGLGVIFLYMGFRQRGVIARVAMIALLAGGIVAGSLYWSRDAGFSGIREDANFNERLMTYQVAWAMYSQSPVLGVGLDCSSVAWPLFAPSERLSHHKWLITHNTFIEALSETGTLGGGLLMAFFAAVIYRGWKTSRSEQASENMRTLAAGLEISFWGFLVCGMSGGYVMSWFPYLLAGLTGAAGRVAMEAQ